MDLLIWILCAFSVHSLSPKTPRPTPNRTPRPTVQDDTISFEPGTDKLKCNGCRDNCGLSIGVVDEAKAGTSNGVDSPIWARFHYMVAKTDCDGDEATREDRHRITDWIVLDNCGCEEFSKGHVSDFDIVRKLGYDYQCENIAGSGNDGGIKGIELYNCDDTDGLVIESISFDIDPHEDLGLGDRGGYSTTINEFVVTSGNDKCVSKNSKQLSIGGRDMEDCRLITLELHAGQEKANVVDGYSVFDTSIPPCNKGSCFGNEIGGVPVVANPTGSWLDNYVSMSPRAWAVFVSLFFLSVLLNAFMFGATCGGNCNCRKSKTGHIKMVQFADDEEE